MKRLVLVGLTLVLILGMIGMASAKSNKAVVTFNIDWAYDMDGGYGLAKLNVNLGGETLHEEVLIPWGMTNEETYDYILEELGLTDLVYRIDKEVINYNEDKDMSTGVIKFILKA